ncbi:MAG: hypothetical protein KGQ69_01510 [Rhodospirillales bacterium]|nr:hypothetical protein [Rhodospirillales bacterium]
MPLSVADTLPEAFKEWSFTEEIVDHEEAIETCYLCGQENIRYHFKIKNQYTNHKLWVGSHCILRFDVAVFDDGQQLSVEDAKKKLDKLTEKMQLDSCIRALQRLAKAEDNVILTSALEYYQKNKKLTPKFAFVVFWRLSENGVAHNPSFFKINLRKKKYRKDLAEMPASRVRYFWSALTTSQRQIALDLGHSPPPNI